MDWLGASVTEFGLGLGPGRAFVSRDVLLDDLRMRLRDGTGFTLATMNLDHAVKLQSDPAFRAAYADHSHVTADGAPVVWLERLAGRRAERVTGADLVLPLARMAAEEGCPIALVGATRASLDGAARRLCAEVEGVRIAARIAPPMGFDPHSDAAERLLDRLESSGARLCLLALGAPRQEVFAARAAARLPGTGFASIGAGLDFLSGHQVRAPRAVRALAMEWAWRLSREPGRLSGRYLRCAILLPGLVLAAVRARGPAPRASSDHGV